MSRHSLACRLAAHETKTQAQLQDGRMRVRLPDELGDCVHDFITLESGLGVGCLSYRPATALIEESNTMHPGRVMVITLGMQGRSLYRGEDRTRLEFAAGHTTISSFSGVSGERLYEAGAAVSQLRVIASETLISKYVGEDRAGRILGNHQLRQLAFRNSTPAAMNHAKALMSHLKPTQQAVSKLDLHIHALSLLNEQFNLLSPEHYRPASPLSPSEAERIERIRAFMAENLDKSLTLDFLSAQFGIGKAKLKEGMLHMYNQTPGDLLLTLRMRKAILLLESGMPVSQVAWLVGYQYANNFTAAFTRYYGKSPRAMFGSKTEASLPCSQRKPIPHETARRGG
ncbi:helix-turn-helix domain-containing protein [Kerstersia gyiorum]|jgi:AraC-like DNA-binding protein|uniref:helix-turn-helix domain-containing protein n=1 Tax=Kerstersia gyiorum TaxID=206506 RepID=UPI0024314D0A|nr:AraC family transcriptional regulator [Kerstersia gyiorum]MCH4271044.1 AraC family transcriptional regulator [Kerstersia gyiorum]MCI1227839.1 AraC family transcriptional regulator [Kerstersia gyiorum]